MSSRSTSPADQLVSNPTGLESEFAEVEKKTSKTGSKRTRDKKDEANPKKVEDEVKKRLITIEEDESVEDSTDTDTDPTPPPKKKRQPPSKKPPKVESTAKKATKSKTTKKVAKNNL